MPPPLAVMALESVQVPASVTEAALTVMGSGLVQVPLRPRLPPLLASMIPELDQELLRLRPPPLASSVPELLQLEP